MKRLVFTVTNDLNYDQRMQRICGSLAAAGYEVTLVGRKSPQSLSLHNQPFRQVRIRCFFNKGKMFYLEFNIRLFLFLLARPMDGICAIDLDSILPCLLVSVIRGKKRIYDAHELFCEMKEISSRPRVYRIWKFIERLSVPRFKFGYTVNHLIAKEFNNMYQVQYEVIRSLPKRKTLCEMPHEKFILYQGAVNEGRCFETLIPAMRKVNARLIICGDGNFMEQARRLTVTSSMEEKVVFKGMVPPQELFAYTSKAAIGITLFEKGAKSNYYSLANRFFDYIQAGTPQVCVNYPLYREIVDQYEIGILIDETDETSISRAINLLLEDEPLWNRLHNNCLKAAASLNWEEEEKKLLHYYKSIFG